MSRADRWAHVSALVLACALARPERLDEVDLDLLAPGPHRKLARIMRRRLDDGLAAGAEAMVALDEVKRECGPSFVEAACALDYMQTSFAGYAKELRGFAAADVVARATENGGLTADALDRARALIAAPAALDDQAILARAGLRPVDVAAMLADPVPEADYLWHGLIERGELAWLAGAGKTGKSVLALYLGAALVSGRPTFLDRPIVSVSRLIYVDAENRERTIRRRLHWCGLDPALASRVTYLQARGADLGSPEGRGALASLAEGGALIVLDSLVALHRIDEDKAGEVRGFADGLREVADETGATILGIAHENRGGNLRGSLDWRNAVDRTLAMSKDSDGVRKLETVDARDDDESGFLRFRYARDGRDDPLRIEVVVEAPGAEVPEVRTVTDVMTDRVLAYRREYPTANRAQTALALGTTRDHGTFRRAWKAADDALSAEPAEAEPPQGQSLPGVTARAPGQGGHPPFTGGALPARPAPSGPEPLFEDGPDDPFGRRRDVDDEVSR